MRVWEKPAARAASMYGSSRIASADERIKIDLVYHMPLPLDPNVPSPL
jgi:hypothetical protein